MRGSTIPTGVKNMIVAVPQTARTTVPVARAHTPAPRITPGIAQL